MKRYRLLLRCVGGAVADHGMKCLLGAVPFGEKLYDIAKDAYERYNKEAGVAERLAQVEAVAQASLEEVRQEVAEVLKEIEARAAPEHRRHLQESALQTALAGYLQQMPGSIRSSLRRPADPSGRSVSSGFCLQSVEDFLRLLPARMPRFKPGDRPVGSWELEELLGVGGFGEVWKARHPSLTNLPPVALKFCLDEESARYLRHEAALVDKMMGYSRYPGIVELRNAYLDAEPPCLEYEFVAGGDLCGLMQDWIGLDSLERMKRATRLVGHLASILAPLHLLDPAIVHRDLKPANVLLAGGSDEEPEVKIGDFGIGGVSARQALAVTRLGVSRGDLLSQTLRGSYTQLYASPEQVRGGEPDPRDDVHALGVIWYQLLVGDLGRGIGSDVDEELREFEVPEWVIGLIRRCVARAERRLPDAGTLVGQLQGLEGGGTISSPSDSTPDAVRSVVVSLSGDGQFRSINEAIQASTSSMLRIEVRPGSYQESVILDRHVELIGTGAKDKVVIEARDGPCIVMKTERAVMRGMTLRGQARWGRNKAFGVEVSQGRLLLEDCDISSNSLACVAIYGKDANPTIRNCNIQGSEEGSGVLVFAQGRGTIEGCKIAGNREHGVEIFSGGNPTVRDCKIYGSSGGGVLVYGEGKGTIERCHIESQSYPAISIRTGGDPEFRECAVHDSGEGCCCEVSGKGGGKFVGCTFPTSDDGAVEVWRRSTPVFQGCRQSDGTPVLPIVMPTMWLWTIFASGYCLVAIFGTFSGEMASRLSDFAPDGFFGAILKIIMAGLAGIISGYIIGNVFGLIIHFLPKVAKLYPRHQLETTCGFGFAAGGLAGLIGGLLGLVVSSTIVGGIFGVAALGIFIFTCCVLLGVVK